MFLTLLNVGQGNCAVLRQGKSAILIDCPPGQEFQSYMASSGIAHISDLIISHAHNDHVGGLAALYRSGIEIDRIWMCDDQVNPSRPYLWVAKVFSHARRERRETGQSPIRRGFPHSDQDDLTMMDASVQFLAPLHESVSVRSRKDTNRLSVVVRILYKGVGIALIPGDLDFPGFREFFEATQPDMRARWLVAPHHGGLSGTKAETVELMTELLKASEAPNVFFSFAGNGPYGHPREEVILAVKDFPGEVGIRCSQLARRCVPDEADQPLATWPTCAGTIALKLDSNPAWNQSGHDEYVSGLPTPMCRKSDSDQVG